ncbi:MAG: hypothetical protein DMF69_24535 [Acidobacteria bacterium]|nr:MAG: hypothetical protein DMF69_24535 [Acidobacteriota bacterium]
MSGRLHITPEADDIGGTTKKTQATSVQNEYSRHIPADLLTTNDADFEKYKKKEGDEAVAKSIYRATQLTYKEVERRMSEALRDRMPALEFEYYKETSIGTAFELGDKTNPDRKTQPEIDFLDKLSKVPAVARQHNHDLMLNFGWKNNVS